MIDIGGGGIWLSFPDDLDEGCAIYDFGSCTAAVIEIPEGSLGKLLGWDELFEEMVKDDVVDERQSPA